MISLLAGKDFNLRKVWNRGTVSASNSFMLERFSESSIYSYSENGTCMALQKAGMRTSEGKIGFTGSKEIHAFTWAEKIFEELAVAICS